MLRLLYTALLYVVRAAGSALHRPARAARSGVSRSIAGAARLHARAASRAARRSGSMPSRSEKCRPRRRSCVHCRLVIASIRLLVTTATPTGAQRVRALFGESVRHAYLPYDLPGAVRRFLDAHAAGCWRSSWSARSGPTCFASAGRVRIPILLASARISERSAGDIAGSAATVSRRLARDVTIAAQTARRCGAVRGDRRSRRLAFTSPATSSSIIELPPRTSDAPARALRAAQFAGSAGVGCGQHARRRGRHRARCARARACAAAAMRC